MSHFITKSAAEVAKYFGLNASLGLIFKFSLSIGLFFCIVKQLCVNYILSVGCNSENVFKNVWYFNNV